MGWSTNIASYPLDMLQVVESVLTTKKECRIPCAVPEVATRLRQRLYGLRKALEVAPDHPLKGEAPKLVLSVEYANSIPYVLVQHCEQTPEATALAAAVASLGA